MFGNESYQLPNVGDAEGREGARQTNVDVVKETLAEIVDTRQSMGEAGSVLLASMASSAMLLRSFRSAGTRHDQKKKT